MLMRRLLHLSIVLQLEVRRLLFKPDFYAVQILLFRKNTKREWLVFVF